ncbi:MAG: hypothetical protein ACYTHN_23670, partial [Planctomycetota bacterium]
MNQGSEPVGDMKRAGVSERGTPIFGTKQWIAVVVVAFFFCSISVNLSLYFAGSFTGKSLRRGI